VVPDAKLQLALQRLETGQFSKAGTSNNCSHLSKWANIFSYWCRKNKGKRFDFDYPFILWVIYPVKIVAEVEIKTMIFISTIMFKDFL
jgi:hypothetical protein